MNAVTRTLAAFTLLGPRLAGAAAAPLAPAEAEWQWSAPDGDARAYLWVPPSCQRVRAVVLANHNMLEQGILEHPAMRATLAELGIAQVWVVPALDGVFDFNKGAGAHFDRVMDALATESGYEELRHAPVVPIGHSACATYPWNFAAWNPQRTLAVLSVKGDAPQTDRTGYGRANVDWGDRSIDGIPGLMVMGEYEWWEDRITPALKFIAKHPGAPIAFLGEAGHGHYDCSDDLVAFLAMFIRKAAEQRLPAQAPPPPPPDQPIPLKPIDPRNGWRIDRGHMDAPATAPPAPHAAYAGNGADAFWCFDEQMARATQRMHDSARGKKPQLLSVTAGDAPPESGCGEPITPAFLPGADGITFRLATSFVSAVPGDHNNTNPARWAGVPVGSKLGRASDGGPIVLSRIVGPVAHVGPDAFAYRPGRAEHTENARNHDMWIIARHPGDVRYKSIFQQVRIRAVPNEQGAPQQINFPPIGDQPAGTATLKLRATSDAGLPVSYYVREGPARVSGDVLTFTPIPPRARFPMRVTIVAWQWGRPGEPAVRTAQPVECTFHLVKP